MFSGEDVIFIHDTSISAKGIFRAFSQYISLHLSQRDFIFVTTDAKVVFFGKKITAHKNSHRYLDNKVTTLLVVMTIWKLLKMRQLLYH